MVHHRKGALALGLAVLLCAGVIAPSRATANNVTSPNWSGYQAPETFQGYTGLSTSAGNICLQADGAYPGSFVRSPDGLFRVIIQTDGNLVEYDTSGDVLWALNETRSGSGNFQFCVQTDGDNVIVNPNGVVIWASHTGGGYTGWCGCTFNVQDDGNAVDYKGATVVWAIPGSTHVPFRYATTQYFFNVPSNSGGAGTATSIWTGFEGAAGGGATGGASLVQDGVWGQTYLDGTQHYFLFWENWPGPETNYDLGIHPGDSIYAYVHNVSATQTQYYVSDSNGAYINYTATTSYMSADSPAYVLEAPIYSMGNPIQYFQLGCRGTVPSSGAQWWDPNGNTLYLNQIANTAYTMGTVNGIHNGDVTVTGVSSGGDFNYSCSA